MTQKFEMADRFNPSAVEQALYQHWEESGYFKPSENENAPSYCIAIPPPNVTGSLHMGHAFQQTLMDTLIRFNRMEGHNTLWQAGTDHAGIATQMVVERKIAAEEGKTRHDYGREAFINKIWDWKAYSGGTISQQMRRLGNSIDWERERFTMDDGLSNAVKEVFVRLHEEGLIYRGKRLVNWDPKLHTAISDLEVENKESKGSLWHFRYPLANGAKTADGKDYLVVATTRPETMLGDTAVAVHPEDERYQSLIGKTVVLPLANREIPIIADEYVDREFGTGVVKITPAHDFNDYEVGKRHSLPMVNVLTLNADIRDEAEIIGTDGKPLAGYEATIPTDYRGLERFAARKKIVADFEALGLLDEIKPHDLKVPYGDRGGVPIEPMLTDQWYVSVKPLADVAIKAVEDGEIQFVPKQYENLYFSWMRDIQDWCISRQLWWGHRIPAWYDAEGNVYVARNEEEVRSKYNLDSAVELKQDEDVLDTWFSSGLWTFSTLGWPEQTKELKMFHPTDVLITGFDIIFFWVARMIMFTMHFVKDENGKPLAGYEATIPTDYRGLERFAARKKIVADFEALGLLDEIKPHDLKVPYGDRGGVPIEPMLTDQWYVSVKPLADVAIKAVEDGEIQFVPKQYENLYFSWMRDIQDWCISRQLWWGHRIPAWYDAEGNVYVARNEEEVRSKYNLDSAVELKQDEDVLDTWFSSGLWTFSTLGWPEQTKELKMFHPTDVLITGFDIIFFWVARMIMFTMHFVKDENGKPQVPFKTVYVTGLIRDENGQKMSKSKGNVLDPIDMIDGISLEDLLEKRTGNMMQPQLAEKIAKATRKEFAEGIAAHGTDALRFTLAALASNGRDINWDMKRLEGYRNFCNKLWNASRFVLTNEKLDLSEGEIEFSLADRWIQSEFNRTVETFRNSLSQYRFDLCANAIYEFTWNQFCDWYLELTKPVFANGNAAQIRAASQTLVHVLEKLLRLAHPLIPFITEEIWQKVKGFVGITADSIILQPFPQVEENGFDPEAEAEIEWLKEVIVAVRNIRAESNIAPSKGLDLLFRNLSAENAKILEKQTALLKAMAKLDNVQVLAANETAPLAVAKLVGNAELLVPMAGFINKEAELARLTKEIEKYQNEVKRIENKLSNEAFVAKAPEAVIAKEREKQAEYQSGLEKIQEQYKAIEAL